MTTRILITLGSLLVLSVIATGQDQKTPPPNAPQPRQKTELAAIGSYAKSIDQFTKRNARKRRIFGIVPSEEDKPDQWQEFKTVRHAVQANLFDSAYVWLKDGKVVAADFSFTSSSGDWYHYVNYYFRADGTLAKIHAQLNTFAASDGGVSVVRDRLYSSNGKLLHTATRYLDLQSQKPRKRSDFMDQPIPDYRTVRALPFVKLLRS
jgi:hypothetical protein